MSLVKEFHIKPGHHVHLKNFDPSYTAGNNKESAKLTIEKNHDILFKLQHRLYAENKRSVLIVLQGMDSSGKDGVIRHVMTGLNPQGCSVYSFKSPSTEELDHDFLWRIHQRVPAKGDMAIFNRSHYEDVLIVRVKNLVAKHVWKERYEQINQFEKMLSDNGTLILKFFLHISKEEQKERLQARLSDPEKNWKFNEADLKERALWKDYQEAYADLLKKCSTPWAPWYVIPSDKKWFRNFAISEIITDRMKKLDLKLPEPDKDLRKLKII